MNLKGKKILLGVTGGIAAYKSCELLRLLQKAGAEVRVAMTSEATKFVAPLTFAALSKCPVYTENGTPAARPFQHIDFPRWADLLVVAPCSANTIGELASGLANDPVSLCFMACEGEKWLAPAMNSAMFLSHAVVMNLARLKEFGVHVLEAPAGELACGEAGPGRMAEPEEILKALEGAPEPEGPAAKNGFKVLITAGRTEEAIDPVRYISNRSSGKTAAELARAFLKSGFEVTVVSGPMEAELPAGAEVVKVRSAVEMHDKVVSVAGNFDALIHCAAVADYRPKNPAGEKIKDSRSQLLLELVPNPNILRECVLRRRPGQVIVGFALETANAERHAEEKLERSGADLLVLNTPVAREGGFGKDSVAFSFVERGSSAGEPKLGRKSELAAGVVEFVLLQLGRKC